MYPAADATPLPVDPPPKYIREQLTTFIEVDFSSVNHLYHASDPHSWRAGEITDVDRRPFCSAYSVSHLFSLQPKRPVTFTPFFRSEHGKAAPLFLFFSRSAYLPRGSVIELPDTLRCRPRFSLPLLLLDPLFRPRGDLSLEVF